MMSDVFTQYILYFLSLYQRPPIAFFFFFNDTATTEIYTLSLHDALPILPELVVMNGLLTMGPGTSVQRTVRPSTRSEEHTSELQSQSNLVCRLLLEKKKKTDTSMTS